MRIHGLVESSQVNGPGNRAVIWTQGCTLGCPGCWNPQTHPSDAGEEVSVDTLVGRILDIHRVHKIDGVTFSGGEPMQQSFEVVTAMVVLASEIPGISLGMYSGYTLRELESGAYLPGHGLKGGLRWQTARLMLDFAVLGRYNATAPVSRPLVTSSNQNLHIFSRYTAKDFARQMIEITVNSQGVATLTGFPTRGNL